MSDKSAKHLPNLTPTKKCCFLQTKHLPWRRLPLIEATSFCVYCFGEFCHRMFPCSWAVSKWPHLGKRAHDDCVGKFASPKMDFRHRRRRFERIDPDDIVQVPSNIFGLIILYLKSLLYNENTSFSYSFRTAFNPVLSFIEMHMAFFGPFFTVVIFVMLLVYVTIAYLIGELSRQLPKKKSDIN